jgi:hypothetical protein
MPFNDFVTFSFLFETFNKNYVNVLHMFFFMNRILSSYLKQEGSISEIVCLLPCFTSGHNMLL